jgi:hypothetical protein
MTHEVSQPIRATHSGNPFEPSSNHYRTDDNKERVMVLEERILIQQRILRPVIVVIIIDVVDV